MYGIDVQKTSGFVREDHLLAATVLLLTGLGLVTLYSSSYTYAERFFNDGLYFITRQLIFALAGIVLFFITSRINLDIVRKLIKPLVIMALLLCLLAFIPGIGVVRNGAS